MAAVLGVFDVALYHEIAEFPNLGIFFTPERQPHLNPETAPPLLFSAIGPVPKELGSLENEEGHAEPARKAHSPEGWNPRERGNRSFHYV